MGQITVLFEMPKTQLALKDPERWNEDWEALCSHEGITPSLIFEQYTKLNNKSTATVHLASSYAAQLETTLTLRWGLSILTCLHGEEFQRGWRATTREVRRHHALFGLSKACAVARDLNECRINTADILTLSHLSDSPDTVLNLVRSMLPPDMKAPPREVYYFTNPYWDAFRADKSSPQISEREKIEFEKVRLLRTTLIYYVLQNILMSFVDRLDLLPQIVIVKDRTPVPPNPEAEAQKMLARKAAASILGRDVLAATIKSDAKAFRERNIQSRVSCKRVGCQITEEAGQRFKRCAKCWIEAQRDVTYCSKDCQRADWKSRHRAVCGKTYNTLDDATKAATLSRLAAHANDAGTKTKIAIENVK